MKHFGKSAFAALLVAMLAGLAIGCSDTGSGGGGTAKVTVTFNGDGGSPETQTRPVGSGGSVGATNMPTEPTKSGSTFGGWYTERNGGGTQFTATTTVYADITVYAKWATATTVPGSTLQAALTWLTSNAVEGGNYAITISADETIGPQTLSYYNSGYYESYKHVSITITGDSTERTVILSSTGSLFTVGSGVTLTLGENLTLQGRSANTAALVRVNDEGTLVMESGAKLTGNTNSSSNYGYGGGVSVGGMFTQSGGTISGNTASRGGGVEVSSSGTFTQSGGEISGNAASNGSGGGVYAEGTFIKQSGGTIYGANASNALKNTAQSDAYGHAVYVSTEKKRNTTAGTGVTMSSALSGDAGGWVDPYTPKTIQISLQTGDSLGGGPITNLTYSSVSGGTWTVQDDGRRQSPAVAHNGVTKSRISFTSTSANASISIQLDVSSEQNYDYAFISELDNASASYSSGYYTGSLISGTQTVTVTIPVPTAGDHFIDIGYQKDGGTVSDSDCAWFKVTSEGLSGSTLSNTSIAVNESAEFSVDSEYASYTWYWDGVAISGETSDSYTLPAASKSAGIYELSVFVTTSAGKLLSARCQVTIRAN